MNMRDIINLAEGLSEAIETHQSPHGGGSYALAHNPTTDEFMRLFTDSHDVLRAIIDDSGDLWVWDADKALHSDVDELGYGTHSGYAFTIFSRHIDAQQCPKIDLRAALMKNPTLVDLKVHRFRLTGGTR